jgi:pilus assembly protein FimV
LFKASLLAALLASAFGAQAAGLGKLSVYSAIGQPLSAEVALTATHDELTSLSAKLASPDAFKEAGVEFMPALAGLRFNVVKLPNNQAVLKLTTDRPLNEAFLHFLVELNWTSGRMVREYTFLLDPPEMLQAAKPASVVSPVAPPLEAIPMAPQPVQAAAEPAAAPKQAAMPPAKPRPTTAIAAKATPVPGEQQVQVKAGDTLSKIARENKSESVSLDQMLVALFNSNRDAFDGNNMNRLRAGKILRIPDATEASQVDAGDARKLIVSQAADFNAYRRRLAAAAQAAPAAESAPQQEAVGKIKPQIEEKAPPAPLKDKLEVSRTEAAKTGAAAGKGSLEEDLIARDKALREAADRIAELEKNLDNLKKLVELKSQAGAQAQQQAEVIAPKPMEAKPPEQLAAKPVTPVEPAVPAKAEKAGPADTQPAAPVPVVPEKPAAQPPAAVTEKPAEPAPVVAPAPKPVPKAVPKKAPPPEPSFVEENPEIVFGGGGLIALLLGYLGYNAWRRKKKASEEVELADEPSVSAGDLASTSGALFGAASESVDSGEVSIQGDFSEGGVLTTEESVDPVAEADVYMAYGRDSQAEEILLEGLKTDPTRSAIHLKLLELYANRKSVDQFQGVASQLHDLNDGQGPDWERAVAMAQGLGVSGGMFGAAVASEPEPPAAPEAEVAAAEEVPPAAMDTVVSHADELAAVPPAPAVEEAASLDFDLDLGTTSGPAAAAVDTPAAPADEAMSLDFDFDLGTPESGGAPGEAEPPADKPAAEVDGNAIDFALDMGSGEATSPVPESELASSEAAVAGGNEIDFDLDLGSGTQAAEEAPPSAVEPMAEAEEIVLADGVTEELPGDVAPAPAGALSDLKLDFDLDLGSESVPVPEVDVSRVVEGGSSELDLGGIDLSLDESANKPEVSAEAAASEELLAPEVELPPVVESSVAEATAGTAEEIDFDLALDAGSGEQASEAEGAAGVAAVELPSIEADRVAEPKLEEAEPLAALPDIDLEAVSEAKQGEAAAEADIDDPEVATKLELAQAYEEMGDREGARELLNEVVNEGSPAQQALARARLDQLDV